MQFRLQRQHRSSIQVLSNLCKAVKPFETNKESKDGVNSSLLFRHRLLVSQQSFHLKQSNRMCRHQWFAEWQHNR